MGSVYLHFTSRYALLGTLIQQEIQVCAPAWVNAIETAPDGSTISGMWRCAMRLHRYADAVMWAIPRRDPQMFRVYLCKSGKLLAVQRSAASSRVFSEAMLVVGAARFDRRWLQCSRSSSRELWRHAQMRRWICVRCALCAVRCALCDARRLDRPYGRCRLDNAFRERACCAPGNRNRIAARRCCREEAEPPMRRRHCGHSHDHCEWHLARPTV
jgi:AcrR family transcriptional regulator